MIAQIKFDKELIILRDEADKLGLNYQEVTRIGLHNNELADMKYSGYHYRCDLIENDGQYYKDDKKMDSYNIYDKPPAGDYVKIPTETFMVDLDKFAPVCKYPFKIYNSLHTEPRSGLEVLAKLESKIQELQSTVETYNSANHFNNKCNVTIGAGIVTTFNEVMLKEDSCTDELQLELTVGWKIIAICIQPDQRRPDYVLGRFNPNIDATITSAER